MDPHTEPPTEKGLSTKAFHIEITENGKCVLSKDYEKVSIEHKRHVSAIYKVGEEKAFTIAPSAMTRFTITAEEIVIPTGAEYYTMDEPD